MAYENLHIIGLEEDVDNDRKPRFRLVVRDVMPRTYRITATKADAEKLNQIRKLKGSAVMLSVRKYFMNGEFGFTLQLDDPIIELSGVSPAAAPSPVVKS